MNVAIMNWFNVWSIALAIVIVGFYFSNKLDNKKQIIGWALLTIGMVFNLIGCLLRENIVVSIICITLLCINGRILLNKYKELKNK